jgi:hypothetical protein
MNGFKTMSLHNIFNKNPVPMVIDDFFAVTGYHVAGHVSIFAAGFGAGRGATIFR